MKKNEELYLVFTLYDKDKYLYDFLIDDSFSVYLKIYDVDEENEKVREKLQSSSLSTEHFFVHIFDGKRLALLAQKTMFMDSSLASMIGIVNELYISNVNADRFILNTLKEVCDE